MKSQISNLKAPPQRSDRVIWSPAAYAANSATQLAWARELIARLALRGDERVLDVGCGDGKISAELARALPRGSVLGVDSSPEMLRFARRKFPAREHPNLKFQFADARALNLPADQFDIVFSNSALHWVDDHPAFLRGAAVALRAGGRLLVSCGGKGNAQDVFAAVRSTMRVNQFRKFFRAMTAPYHFYRPEDYERWLPRFGFASHAVSMTEKLTQLDGPAALATSLRTTWLPYTQRVPDVLREEFITSVVERFVSKHPPDAHGKLAVRTVRLEIDAVKTGALDGGKEQ